MDFLTLDWRGILLAVVFALLFLAFGLGFGYFFILVMFVFLVLSAIVTYIDLGYKKKLGIGQGPRGIKNVIANGLPAIVMVVLFYGFNRVGNGTLALLAVIGFVASVAAITADKFNSEIGVLSRTRPRMIFTMKKVKKGTSGGLSLLGTFSGLIGALIISLLIVLIASQLILFKSAYPFGIEKAITSITLAGFIGSFIDSILGYYEEKGIGNKFTSNFACGIAAGLIAMLLFTII